MRRLLPLLFLLAACSSDGDHAGHTTASGGVVVSVKENGCEVDGVAAQGVVLFAVKNDAKEPAVVRVEDADGKPVAAVSDVGSGSSTEISAELAAGHYKVLCNGAATDLHVSGPTSSAKAGREVAVTAKDFSFEGLDGFTAKTGDSVLFRMTNTGSATHELRVLAPGGKQVGDIGHTAKGRSGETTVTFAKAGTYTYLCAIDDHTPRGMKGTFTID